MIQAPKQQDKRLRKLSAWEHLVDDYLEVHATLQSEDREFLITSLKSLGVSAQKIIPLSAFTISGHHVIVDVQGRERTLWLYDPQGKTFWSSVKRSKNLKRDLPD